MSLHKMNLMLKRSSCWIYRSLIRRELEFGYDPVLETFTLIQTNMNV